MNLQDFHKELAKLLYIEDEGMFNIILASIVANSLKIGDPVWLTLIGPSSGGKSQFIRPFAKANPSLIHRVDDLTPNTFISGSLGLEHSMLGRIGEHGILSMDDLTVLFSKNSEARGEILSQFRMLYDGSFTKSSGSRKDVMAWNGYMGMISGSTPLIYRFFAEVADMGERFVNYRMKVINKKKAIEFITNNPYTAMELDMEITELIKAFLAPLMAGGHEQYLRLSDEVNTKIADVSDHCTLLRTAVHIDDRNGFVDEFPESEMPFRVMKQLKYLAQALQVMNKGALTPDLLEAVEWTGWSLANDKRREYLKCCVALDRRSEKITARNISAMTGLHREVVKKGLDHLQSLKIISLYEEDVNGEYRWKFTNQELKDLTMRIDPPTEHGESI